MPSPALRVAPGRSRTLLFVVLLGASCTGTVGESAGGPRGNNGSGGVEPGPGNGSGNGGSNPGNGGPNPGNGGSNPGPVPMPARPAGICSKLDPGPSPLRLLTKLEYMNTVRDLLGDAGPASALQDDPRPQHGYTNDASSRSASDPMVAAFMATAEKLAAAAVGDLGKIVDCAGATDDACLGKFLDGFARRAWRRPLTAAEKQNLTLAFNDAKAAPGAAGFKSGIEAAITVLLMSPQFLYRYEQGTPVAGSDFTQLDHWEVASRLSYLLWGSMPDPTLLAAAAAGKLGQPAEVMAQARRMVNEPRFLATLTEFGDQYLHLDAMPTLDKDTETLPAWRPELREALRTEGKKFLEHVLAKDGDGKISTLLTANYSFLNGPLAAYYGLSGPSGEAFAKVSLDPARSSGFLTQAGFLSVHGTPDKGLTSLVFRGIFVRESLLCQSIPEPPPGAEDENPPFTPTTTPREWAEARMAKPVCGTCHRQTDPIGYGFENFDPIGRYQTMDRGKAIDASARLEGSDVDGTFKTVPELGKMLARSKQVGACLATQWFRFASGRAETPRDACSLATLQEALDRSGGDLREMFVAYTQTDAFLYRSKGDAP